MTLTLLPEPTYFAPEVREKVIDMLVENELSGVATDLDWIRKALKYGHVTFAVLNDAQVIREFWFSLELVDAQDQRLCEHHILTQSPEGNLDISDYQKFADWITTQIVGGLLADQD
ncbi:MAG TPA: hypothetical protein PLD10_13145 [Rhodopila sp.]|nr:hypothetical protein [Rhodopila sp.]